MKLFKRAFPLTLATGGLLLVLAAVFARQIRLDNNDHWGMGRYVLAACGMGLWFWLGWILSAAWRRLAGQKLGELLRASLALPPAAAAMRIGRQAARSWRKSTLARRLNLAWERFLSLPGVRFVAADPGRQAVFWAACGLLLVLVMYTWLATAGTMVHLTPASGFIDMQGKAFLKGQLSLVETPPPDLLALKNPYDLSQRLKLKYIWDASLFEGKYYLYWGPLPALADALYRGASGQGLGDEVFGFGLLCLLALVQTLWLLDLRTTFFPKSAPLWLFLFVPAACMISPLSFNISGLSVYVVSTLSAQVFLLGGVLLVRRVFSGVRVAAWRWAACGLLFGLAVSARLNLLLAIAWIGLLLLLWALAAGREKWSARVKPLLFMGGALGLVLAAIMLYNTARFHSPFEFGSRYQLTVTDINHFYNSVVSGRYIPPNLYVYLFRPPGLRSEFPFIYSQWVTGDTFPAFIVLPPGYLSTDPVDGLLLTAPFLLLALVPPWRQVTAFFRAPGIQTLKAWYSSLFSERIILWMMYGSGLAAFAFILTFYYPTMRYLIDSTPMLAPMAAVGGWQWMSGGRARTGRQAAVVILVIMTVTAGFLLCINGPHDYFERANPGLYYHLIGLFKGQ